MNALFFDQFFEGTPPGLALEPIRAAWQALPAGRVIEQRRPPVPIWARRGLTETGPEAWTAVQATAATVDPARPLCIYVHVPFCARKCAFCDCYSFRLEQHVEREVSSYLGGWSTSWSCGAGCLAWPGARCRPCTWGEALPHF